MRWQRVATVVSAQVWHRATTWKSLMMVPALVRGLRLEVVPRREQRLMPRYH